MESATNVAYIKSSGLKTASKEKVDYYYCSRSGYFISKGKGRRALKSQSTSKIDSYCTSKIILHHFKHSVQADIVKTHYGHKNSLGHLRLPKHIRQAIAGQLLQGVSFDSVLDKVRDSVGPQLE